MKLELSRWLLCRVLDCFCGNEHRSVFAFGGEDTMDVCDSSCVLGTELVTCLTARLICVLLELMSNGNHFAAISIVGISQGHCCFVGVQQ